MKQEKQIKEKIVILKNSLKQTEKEFVNKSGNTLGEIYDDFSFYKSKKLAIDYFIAGLEWVLE